MDRGVWRATVYGVTEVEHYLTTKPPATYTHTHTYIHILSFPGGSDGKESTCDVGDLGLISGEGNSYQCQYSGLENSMDRGAWQATVHGFTESDTTEQISLTHIHAELINEIGKGIKLNWRREQQPTPIFLPGKSHGPRSLIGYSPWVTKSWAWLSKDIKLTYKNQLYLYRVAVNNLKIKKTIPYTIARKIIKYSGINLT